MKKYILFILTVIVLAACAKEYEEQSATESPVFNAVMENSSDAKVYLDEYHKCRWNDDDRISIFIGNTENQQYKFDGETGDDGGSFSPVESTASGSGSRLSGNISVYPYQSSTSVSEEGVISFNFPSTQLYESDSYGVGANTMVAVTEDSSDMLLMFKNACGYLRISLYGDMPITSIVLRGNNGEKISGAGTITASHSGMPSVVMSSEATDSIMIDCGEGEEIGSMLESARDFYFVVPPVEFSKGITICATGANEGVFTKSTNNPITITRNKVQKMAAVEYEGVGGYDTPHGELTFSAYETSTIALKKIGSPDDISLEYLVKKSYWAPYTVGETITLSAGDRVSFRAGEGGNSRFSKTVEDYYTFSIDGVLASSGNIMSLLDQSLERASVPACAFYSLFGNCTGLAYAPELPATTLAERCYQSMFSGCQNLMEAPELPATTLANHCYQSMFTECGILFAPELPATTLADYCYQFMFGYCTGLTYASSLPATTLADYCYQSMFTNCTSLINAPNLPATTLADYCYQSMFNNCTSLRNAPGLPATTLADYCYHGMFTHCTSLREAPELPATTLALLCYGEMFSLCGYLTSAPDLPATTLADYCYKEMFQGCINLISVPALPATTLTKQCYASMFSICASLTSAPELPADTLMESCYNHMFEGCLSLKNVKMLATDVSATNCMKDWLKGVFPTGTFVKNSAATWDITGASGVPEGWTVQYASE